MTTVHSSSSPNCKKLGVNLPVLGSPMKLKGVELELTLQHFLVTNHSHWFLGLVYTTNPAMICLAIIPFKKTLCTSVVPTNILGISYPGVLLSFGLVSALFSDSSHSPHLTFFLTTDLILEQLLFKKLLLP